MKKKRPFIQDPSATAAFAALRDLPLPRAARAPRGDKLNAVVIGGGTGAPVSIRTLLSLGVETSAVVAMADDGGSTGLLREEADVTPVVREHVWTELAPQLTAAPNRGAVLGSEKYEAAAKVAEWQGLEPRHVADLLLRAAWCCVDEGDVEAERYFRRKAAWAFAYSSSSKKAHPSRTTLMRH